MLTRSSMSIIKAVGVGLTIAAQGALPGLAHAEISPLEAFFDNTLVCQDHQTKAVCHAWFNLDGKYYVFYDLGPQSKPAAVAGPFQFEGREGSYTVRERAATGVELCLRPATPVVTLSAQHSHEFLSEAACYPLPLHEVGARWDQADAHGRQYSFWLMAGR